MTTIAVRLLVLLLTFLSVGAAFASGETQFPLRIAAGGTHLEDSAGKPFLITGDAAWSLIADLSVKDAGFYIADRKARGFNAILVSLIEHQFSRNAPNDAAGNAPFFAPGDFTQPNDAYFAAVERVLDVALKANMLVLLAPAYLGANGGPEGWYLEMTVAGPDALRSYGRYVGKRFARYPNILWVEGGDYDPPDRGLIDALATGIAEGAPGALQTVHGGRDTVTSSYWPDASWLALDTVYTYGDTAAATLARYRSGPRRPFFLIESRYEGEHGVDAFEVRKIAYSALLSGASGQVFGNNPVWHFGGPALYEMPTDWKTSLGSRGAVSMDHLAAIFGCLDWWTLVPDESRFARHAEGTSVAAISADRALAVVYLYDADSVDLDLAALSAQSERIAWYDPSTGEQVMTETIGKEAGELRLNIPASKNASGASDWLLVIRSER